MRNVLVIVSLFCLGSMVDARGVAKSNVRPATAFVNSGAAGKAAEIRTVEAEIQMATGQTVQIKGLKNVGIYRAALAAGGVKSDAAVQGVVANMKNMTAQQAANANQWLIDLGNGKPEAKARVNELKERCKVAA